MDVDVNTVNDTIEIAVETTQKVVYTVCFIAGGITTVLVEHAVAPKVADRIKRRRARKVAKKHES